MQHENKIYRVRDSTATSALVPRFPVASAGCTSGYALECKGQSDASLESRLSESLPERGQNMECRCWNRKFSNNVQLAASRYIGNRVPSRRSGLAGRNDGRVTQPIPYSDKAISDSVDFISLGFYLPNCRLMFLNGTP